MNKIIEAQRCSEGMSGQGDRMDKGTLKKKCARRVQVNE
jgi:hypothetical protein